MEALSASRKISLQNFLRISGAPYAIVLLYEYDNQQHFLLAAYSAESKTLAESLRGRSFKVETDKKQNIEGSTLLPICDEVARVCKIDEPLAILPMKQRPLTGSREENFIGAIIYPTLGVEDDLVRAAANVLTGEFELSRSQRIVETGIKVQELVQYGEDLPGNILKPIAKCVSEAVFCSNIFLKYNDTETFLNLETEKSESVALSEDGALTGNFAERCEILMDGEAQVHPAVVVPVDRSCVNLTPKPFTPMGEFLDTISPTLHSRESIVFAKKIGNHYLQNHFSKTDLAICNRVFFSVQAFLSANEFENRFNQVVKQLTELGESATSSFEEHNDFLTNLDKAIASVSTILVKRNDESFSVEVSGESRVNEAYLERLSKSYLSENFGPKGRENSDGVFVGIDVVCGNTTIEIHLSSHLNDGQVFLITLRNSWISEATLRSMLHYFSEIHVRLKRKTFLEERETFISQVRHIVVHHISSAQKSLKVIQRAWNNSVKDPTLWSELRQDPEFRSFLDMAVSNMGISNRKLELGRFIIDEITPDSLNRKQMNPVSIIEETLLTFKYDREDKNIIFKSVLKGSQPSVLNGDHELFSVAMVNLIDNAIKYSAVGELIEWGIEYKDTYYRFHISNIGDPIQAQESKDAIIRTRLRAKQMDHLNQRHGTGWGLPVAAKILKAHHPSSILDYETDLNVDEPNRSKNTFFFTMPYRTGKTSMTNGSAR